MILQHVLEFFYMLKCTNMETMRNYVRQLLVVVNYTGGIYGQK